MTHTKKETWEYGSYNEAMRKMYDCTNWRNKSRPDFFETYVKIDPASMKEVYGLILYYIEEN